MSIRTCILRMIAFALMLASMGGSAYAQTTEICLGRIITRLDFRNPVRISGSNLAVGSQYRFSNVTTGVDAIVRIDAFNNGASLTTIDNDAVLTANFNPELGGADARSVDFTITLVNSLTVTPRPLDIVATGIDIDGDSVSLREYAEFSTPFAEYRLNNPTNINVNASGPSVPGNFRFEARTSANAPGIDPNANQNIAAVFYSQTSSFRYRIGALGTGATTRLTSLDFTCPNLPNPTPTPVVPQDFGDAPTAAYGNPIHDIITGIRLGATNTAETAPYNNVNANADAGDDGITISALTQGLAGSITATVAGPSGRLQAWFDWNGDGDFADAGEQIATNIQDNQAGDSNPAVGSIRIDFTVPALAVTTRTYARFRWSTQADLPPTTIIARDGEVEDYAVTVIRRAAVLTTQKTNAITDPTGINRFHIPGNDITYTITTTNIGNGPADTNSVFVYDSLPTQIEYFNGDFNGPAAGTAAVLFSQSGTGLTFTPATDLRYSNLVAPPANFAACVYTPAVGYDPLVRHICFNPKGAMANGSPSPSFTLQFRARIR